MNSLEDYGTFEELSEFFSKKISLLNECLELKCMDNEAIFFRNFETSVIELRNLFQQIKLELKNGQDQLTEMKGLLKRMESLNDRLDHMQKNFPAVLKPQQSEAPKRERAAVAGTPTVSKKVKLPVTIKHITLAEFESIPKYMKGRLQYTQINCFIDSFNKVITTKYKLLSMPRKLMKPAEFKICNIMKSEETGATKELSAKNVPAFENSPEAKCSILWATICKGLSEIIME